MADTIPVELTSLLQELRKELVSLSDRIAKLENRAGTGAAVVRDCVPEQPVAAPEEAAGVTEEELLAISAALAAYLGVRVHIRQIRLISSRAWAQEGRVTVQASHRLHT